ncbi:nuclear transport factor 2 family protein [Frankia sp. CNm7]|uniref:Nuclear transport factor 2 family protein n=1 Tax=Frankia nepalensis TaxID=1836974 RepID=A0A937RPM3_9ACTN|nr:nuclear transport factor 2 family protein [Frankia nepalensis]MBL7495846.1 nuclear transport factor 2 family protein [Frankia nepalensis]MBL7509922.1 nuclear transport factor 2 family protein [Frankia nepalensis]MBL7523699.1 nuclear transport factor 2 family protein [Frankia nepalensis]MBL7629681.1 nuclear transport factor 2 family protein [Frankia nepalensis]
MLPSPADHVAISALYADYCLTMDLDDVEGWVALFTPDARYEVYGRVFEGHDKLRKMLTAAPRGTHLGGLPRIEMVGPDRASVRRNLVFLIRGSDDIRSAFYTDDLVRTPDGWRIAACRCQFETADGLSDRPDR